MGSLYLDDVLSLALSEVGYHGGKGISKYTAELDECNYWQMPPKNGCPDADWCSIFVNWLIYRSTRNSSGEIEPSKWDAHYFTFEPDNGENLAAGCGYAADYYMQNDAWDTSCQGACRGDQVFFRNFAHTGIVVDWDDDGIYTVEGNTIYNGQKYSVAKKFYRYDDPAIDGFGHPRYDGDEYKESDDDDAPSPEPKPEPQKAVVELDVLERYDTGSQVNTLKALLKEFEYGGSELVLDGDFDWATEEAVKNFQESHDLPVTGIVDQETWKLLLL